MDDRILCKATAHERYFDVQLISRSHNRHVFFPRTSIVQLERDELVIIDRIHTLAFLSRNDWVGGLNIIIHWPDRNGLPQRDDPESVHVPYGDFMDFFKASARPDGPTVWKALDMNCQKQPKFVFEDREKLQQCLNNRIVRKKLIRYLRDHFSCDIGDDLQELHFCHHPKPYSFSLYPASRYPTTYSRELVLTNQQSISDAQYMIHYTGREIETKIPNRRTF